jgi:hypothetical protein
VQGRDFRPEPSAKINLFSLEITKAFLILIPSGLPQWPVWDMLTGLKDSEQGSYC